MEDILFSMEVLTAVVQQNVTVRGPLVYSSYGASQYKKSIYILLDYLNYTGPRISCL